MSRAAVSLSADRVLSLLRAAGEETRLRIILLLNTGELNVSDITHILGQSQPRISRHLKLLVDSGLVERAREGSWAFYRLNDTGAVSPLLNSVIGAVDRKDPVISRDAERLAAVRARHAQRAREYFASHARDWNLIRSLHVEEEAVESAIVDLLDGRHFPTAVDLGTGTGRMLELVAGQADVAIGVDLSHEMLAVARSALEQAGLAHCRVRHGDISSVPLETDSADLVLVHQVLHFLSDPTVAINEAARVLAPGGSLMIVDFSPHQLEFLRESHAHQRLGFENDQMVRWFHGAGLTFDKQVELPAPEGEDSLTVSIWLARDPRAARTVSAPQEGTLAS
ncbi:MAG: metalloregulator ArsR/SmtB family transcription factor [Pseudomonadota bacterium]